MSRILVTGATGFVGHFLCTRLLADNFILRGTLLESESKSSLVDGVNPVRIRPLSVDTIWSHALDGEFTWPLAYILCKRPLWIHCRNSAK